VKNKLVFAVLYLISLSAFSFPALKEWQNSPLFAYENKTQPVLKKDLLLKTAFALATANRDQAALVFNQHERVTVYEKSRLQVIDINSETGSVSDLYFYSGKIRYQNNPKLALEDGVSLTLKSPFFELKMPSEEVDFFIELDMKKPKVTLKVVKGYLAVEFFSYERKEKLLAGQQLTFIGELASDKQSIKYDYLLNNKKVPRGNMGQVKDFNHIQYLKAEERARLAEIKRKKDLEFKRLEKIRKQKEYEDSFLCKKPFGNKDQCAWKLENGKCFRQRCNVSGQWGDVTERPINSNCKPDFVVDVCDY
jgi:hypothetical protein